MDPMTLNLNALVVETFETSTPDATLPVGGMKTYEPGCTTPDLCPNGVVIGRPKTMEPGCTAFPELCPTATTVAVA